MTFVFVSFSKAVLPLVRKLSKCILHLYSYITTSDGDVGTVFSKNRPLGRFFHKVTMSVYVLFVPFLCNFLLRLLIGPQVT